MDGSLGTEMSGKAPPVGPFGWENQHRGREGGGPPSMSSKAKSRNVYQVCVSAYYEYIGTEGFAGGSNAAVIVPAAAA